VYLTQTNKLRKIDTETFNILVTLSCISKNLYNVGVYSIRQNYFNNGKYLDYYKNYHECKTNENYKLLGSCGQCTLRHVDYSFRSFFKLLKKSKEGVNLGKVNIPGYLDKDSFYTVTWASNYFKVVDDKIRLSMSRKFKKQFTPSKEFLFFDLPKNVNPNTIKEVMITSYHKCSFFKIHFIYKKEREICDTLNFNKFLSIDMGINNFAACIDSSGESFILDGRKLKSINQKYNKDIELLKKEITELMNILIKQ